MPKYIVVYQETFSEEIEAENTAAAQLAADSIRRETVNRKLLSVTEDPPPFPEDHQCPECADAKSLLIAQAIQRANLKKAPKKQVVPLLGGPDDGPRYA